MTDETFIKKYEELLDKGYCNCNEMNCLDNDTPRKILNIVKGAKLEAKQLLIENQKRKEVLNKIKEILDNHDKNADNLYYKYDGKYLLSEIKKDIRDILKEVDK